MPIPAVPRRAAPPRRKKEAPKPSDEPPAPSQEKETATPAVKIPLPESTSDLLADVGGEKAVVPSDVNSTLITERPTSLTLIKSGDRDDAPEDALAPSPQKEDQPVSSEGKLTEVVEEGKEIEELSGIDQPEQDLEEPLNEVSNDEEPIKPLGPAVRKMEEPNVLTVEPDVKEDMEEKPEEEPEEEDEAPERVRITARLAKSGGFNPFAGGPPARKPSESSPPERRTSVESPGPSKPTLHDGQEPPTQLLAGRDADPIYDETGFPTTQMEEDKPSDTLKRVEGDS
ncbi:hypothetical protein BDM02DRAFT_3122484 [Thelephora ganbajun]|uniref:Uncharacterized protein n=1 Tax=Thelephora ganbajun TaxID=370292 RepID=A0ACB6Z395_THEGA|nr:hypothetical protein BDM02DRAFT_3122484 [Thelephora ganbajun]